MLFKYGSIRIIRTTGFITGLLANGLASENGQRHDMTPDDFRRWRKALGLKQKDAADALGLKKRVIQYYEKGDRDGKAVEIPVAVALACYAISQGVTRYDASELIYESE